MVRWHPSSESSLQYLLGPRVSMLYLARRHLILRPQLCHVRTIRGPLSGLWLGKVEHLDEGNPLRERGGSQQESAIFCFSFGQSFSFRPRCGGDIGVTCLSEQWDCLLSYRTMKMSRPRRSRKQRPMKARG